MDELYFEEGYVEVGYFAKTILGDAALSSSATMVFDGDIADTSNYYIPDYIDLGYFENGVVVSGSGNFSASTTVSITVTKIVQGDVEITGAFNSTMTVNAIRFVDSLMEMVFSLSSTVNKTVDSGATLANIANLDAQANKVSGFAAAAAAEFTLTADTLNVQFADSNMSSDFALLAAPISYVSKWTDSLRPIDIEYSVASFDASIKKYGTHSLKLNYNGYANSYPVENFQSTSFEIPADTDFVMESWVYFDTSATSMTTNVQPLLFGLGAASGDARGLDDLDEITSGSSIGPVIGLQVISGQWRPKAIFVSQTGITTLTSSISVSPNTWVHLALTRNSSGTLNLLVNNSTRATGTNSGRFVSSTSDRISFKNNFQTPTGGGQVWFDGFTARLNNSTISTYASYPESSEQTIALYNFDNNLLDDLSVLLEASSNISGAFTPQVTANISVDADINLDSAFEVTVDTAITRTTAADLNSEFTQSTAPDYIIQGEAALSSSFAVTAAISITKKSEVTLNSQFEQTTAVVKTVDCDSSFNLTTTLTADPAGTIIRITSDLVSTTTVDAIASRTQQGDAALEDQFILTAQGISGIEGNATLTSNTQLIADNNRFRNTSVDMPAVASQLTAAVKIGDFFINADVQATLNIEPTVLAAGSVAIESIATMSTTAQKITDVESNQTVTATVDAEGTSNIVGEALLETVVNITTNSVKIATANSNLSVDTALDAQAVKTARATSVQNATTQLNTVANRTRGYNSDLNSEFTATINAGINANASANLPSITSALIVARELRIEQYVYQIPSENRTHSIQRETRSHSVRYETRTHAIEGT